LHGGVSFFVGEGGVVMVVLPVGKCLRVDNTNTRQHRAPSALHPKRVMGVEGACFA
jgi:hypothetical protein